MLVIDEHGKNRLPLGKGS